MFTLSINGKRVSSFTTHNDARYWANRLYDAYAEIILNGYTDDSFAETELHKYDIDGEIKIMINGRNWREYLADVDRIENLIKTA